MGNLTFLGKTIISIGAVVIFIGFVIYLFGRLPGIGRLPGDIYIRKESFTFYFPLATSLLVSLILSLIFTLFMRK